MKPVITFIIVFLASLFSMTTQLSAQEVLPFPEPGSASTAGKTLKDSKHQWRQAVNRLLEDAPNIVIFMNDNAGFTDKRRFARKFEFLTSSGNNSE